MTDEDDEFVRIEKESLWRKRQIEEDLGQPVYFKPKKEWVEKEWVGLTAQEYDEIYASNKDRIYDAMMVVATYLKRKNHG